MTHADSSYSSNHLTNYYLITFISSVLGEAIDCSDNYIGFQDEQAPDKSGINPVVIEAHKISIIDDFDSLHIDKMYKIIGYCKFHNIDFVINGQLEEKFWRYSWRS